ncbi:MAG: glycerate kinase [Acidobacteria bacterium]|nr:glycerate kinase [Acidobacteriota bacterium]
MPQPLRKHAMAIFRASLEAADPVQAVLRFMRRDGEVLHVGKRRYDLSRFANVYVLGAGKASAAMAQGVERVLGRRIRDGLVNVKYGHGAPLRRVRVHECSHPVPDEAGVEGARQIAAMASAAGAGDLVVCVISGGASALTPSPVPPITLVEKQATTRLLLECGANIHEINTVRKHISGFKGGQLARLAAPATLVVLMLSDVIGDSMDVIGSGPAVPDHSTFADAAAILRKFTLWDRIPASVCTRIEQGMAGAVEETPKEGDPAFARAQNLVVGSNQLAVDAAAAKAKELGYRVLKLSTFIEGETRDVAGVHAAIARQIHATGEPLRPPACILSGGETTVAIRGGGLGGRNQEFALAAATGIEGLPRTLVLSGGTDGSDGPTDAAGAIVDGGTVELARKAGLDARDFLARNDSYHFFDPIGGLIRTGPTRTNVMDVRIVLVGAR